MCENKCCANCYKSEFCSGSGWYCKLCGNKQNRCSIYKNNKISNAGEVYSRKESK